MNKIYVGNLPYNVSEQDLESAFEQFGDIEEIIIIKDRNTGRSKGFGFVTFGDQATAEKALEMNGKDFHGRSITVNMAREKTERRPGGGQRRRDW